MPDDIIDVDSIDINDTIDNPVDTNMTFDEPTLLRDAMYDQ
jgi:hypothetical protein